MRQRRPNRALRLLRSAGVLIKMMLMFASLSDGADPMRIGEFMGSHMTLL
jgi:hypothetical protein